MTVNNEAYRKAVKEDKNTLALVTLSMAVIKTVGHIGNNQLEEAERGLNVIVKAAVAALAHNAITGNDTVKEMIHDFRERTLRESASGSSPSGAEKGSEGSPAGTRE